MGIFGLIFAAVSLGLNAYNAYASSSAQEDQLDLAKQQLVQAGIRTEAEKRLAEMKINDVTAQTTTPAPAPAAPGTLQSGANLFTVLAALAFGAILFRAIIK